MSTDARRPGDAPPRRVLVIDADPDARRAARDALEPDWSVIEASDAESARSAPPPDVILIDPALPAGGGEALIESAVAPVVVSTGFDGFERPTLDRGARSFLRKPADSCELVRALAAAQSGTTDTQLTADNRARTGRLRAEAADARERLLAGAALDDASLRDQLRALTAWAAGYFGVRRAFVLILERGRLRVLAESGAAPLYPEDAATDPMVHFDTEVITAAAPLVVADTAAHAVFATHPAAAISSFYAGAPLFTTDHLALGTLCVEDVNPTAFHAEDAALLAALARRAGALLEPTAQGVALAPALFAAPGVFTAEALDALITAELGRATRGKSAMELALITLREPLQSALDDISHDVARVGRRRFALALDHDRLAVVCGDVTRDLVRRRVDHAVSSFAWRHPVAAAGAASIDPATRQSPVPSVDRSPGRLRTAALDMLDLASRAPPGPIQRIALA